MDTIHLKTVFVHVTKKCNLRCSYCYFSAGESLQDEMSTKEFGQLWPDVVTLQPQKVIFTGGEPLSRADLVTLLRDLRDADPEHHIIRCLNTNGHLMTFELANQLVGLADEVRVSLDALQERNDVLRGPGNFKAAIRALEYLYSVGFEPKVLITITSANLPDLSKLICLLVSKKITRFSLNSLRMIGRASGHAEWSVSPTDVHNAVQRAWEQCYPSESLPLELPEPEIGYKCGVGSFLNIMPNGDVFPCHVLTHQKFRCGNVREQSLLDICHSGGLLDYLQTLDLNELALQDKRLAPLRQSRTCMGIIYPVIQSLSDWDNYFPK